MLKVLSLYLMNKSVNVIAVLDVAKMVISACTGSCCLDYTTSVLYGTSQKTSPNFKEHRTSLHGLLLVPFSPVYVISSGATGFPSNTVFTSLSTLFISLNLLTYIQHCMFKLFVIPLILSSCQIPVCFLFRSSALYFCFSMAAPTIWNSLPPALQICTIPDNFHHHLKTSYFQQAFRPT